MPETDRQEPSRGRPRNAAIDTTILSVAVSHLARFGYEGMSLTAIAEEAGTTRQALYRRWPTKADLATAAIASLSRAEERLPTDDAFGDLVREVAAFQEGVSRPNGIQMVGLMLLGSTDAQLVDLYRRRIVIPRRSRLLAILQRAQEAGAIPAEADIELGVNALVGSWYARELSGEPIPAEWPRRAAGLVWRGLGGTDAT